MLQTTFGASCMNRASVFEWHKVGSLWGMMRGMGGVRKSIHHSWLVKGLGLGLGLCYWGFKGVQEEIPREEASTLQIGSVAFPPGQCTSPQLHPSHRLFDQDGASRQFLSLPLVQSLLPVTFAYSLDNWDNWWDERGCGRSLTRSHKRTSMGPFRSYLNGTTRELQPEEITSKGTRVSCVYYQ